MHLIFVDFETFWSEDYTLKKMSPGEYISDPRFELQSAAIKVGREPTRVYFGARDIHDALRRADSRDALVCGHNLSGFDGLILSWKLGLTPKMFGCTLAMARPVYGHLTPLGLGALVKFLGIGIKDDAILHQTKGRHLADFTPDELDSMRVYNCADTDQCAELFYHLAPFFSPGELWQIDTTIRARCYPQLELDIPLLEATLEKERTAKRLGLLELADAIGVQQAESDETTFEAIRARLASAPKFVSLLDTLGVDVPYKPSPTNPARLIPALAKTDDGFLELLDSENELVAQAAAARLSIKSTLLETRIGKLITARNTATALPIPLKYAGAKVTDRWSGEEYNPQNLPRINKAVARNSDALRQSIVAPDGYVIGVSDAASIELRVNHHLWQVPRSVAAYQASPTADLYSDFAAERWHVPVADVTSEQRHAGKVSHLQLQFGSGWKKFKATAKSQHRLLLTEEEAQTITAEWRQTYREIPAGWDVCADSLRYIAEGTERDIDPGGLCRTRKDAILLPSGSLLRYPNLRQILMSDPVTGAEKWEWVYGAGRFVRRIYGPKVVANVVQKLARDVVAEVAIDFFKETGLRWVMMTHDELIYLFPQADATSLLATLQSSMRTRRQWWPELVLWSSGGLGSRYSQAH